MKKILLPILVLLSSVCFGQAPIALDTVNNACHIDKIGFAKDNMTYTLYGDSSINLFIVGAASYQNTHYSRFRDPGGNPFANRAALTNWIDLYFFANALADSTSGSGGDTATLESVTTGTGNNITPNAIQVKDAVNINLDSQTTVMYNYGAAINAGGVGVTPGTGSLRRMIEYSEDGGSTTIYNDPQSQSLLLRAETGSNAGLVSSGRIQALSGINANDVAVMSQMLLLGETSTTAYRGDRGVLAYNHSQITDGTNPHATTFANIASKPTTVSGYGITDALIDGGNTPVGTLNIGTTNSNTVNFIVNGSAVGAFLTTGNFRINNNVWQNSTSSNNATIGLATTGTTIAQNLAAANTVLKVNHTNASSTGSIAEFQKAGVTLASVNNTGTMTAVKIAVSALNTSPASATDTGTTGEIRVTAGFIYVCIATNVWVRAALATW